MAYTLGNNFSAGRQRSQGVGSVLGRQAAKAQLAAGPGQALTGEAELARQRQLMEDSLSEAKAGFRAQATGQLVPYTRDVIRSLHADSAGAAAGANQAALRTIGRAFGGRGLAASGGELSARLAAKRQIGGDAARARRQTNQQATLQNFGAGERGRAGLASILPVELEHRGRYNVVGEDELDRLLKAILGGAAAGGARMGVAGGTPQPRFYEEDLPPQIGTAPLQTSWRPDLTQPAPAPAPARNVPGVPGYGTVMAAPAGGFPSAGGGGTGSLSWLGGNLSGTPEAILADLRRRGPVTSPGYGTVNSAPASGWDQPRVSDLGFWNRGAF